jgi:hypothetical protein
VALILAVNPGNRYNPTLSRLARELKGCEIVGAESCSVAISAIKKRLPDVLLLPVPPARGEADLMAHVKSIPGGVLTLKLPPVESADPVHIAKQVRGLLTGVPAFSAVAPAKVATPVPIEAPVPGPSPHLLAAAAAAVAWAHERRAQWSQPIETDVLVEPREPAEPRETADPRGPAEPEGPELYAPIGPYEAIEVSEEIAESDDPAALFGTVGREGSGRNITALLPRAAAAAVVIGLAAAALWYWRGGTSSSVEQPGTANEAPRPVEAPQQPIESPPAAKPEPEPGPLANASGRVAVSSPFEISITEDGQPVPRDDQGRLVLAPGKHRLRFQEPERGYDATRTVQVTPAETTTLTLTPDTTIAVTSNEPAEVLIDGTRVGDTPYQGRIGLGAHAVTVRTAGAERQLTVEATSKPVQLEVDFSKP